MRLFRRMTETDGSSPVSWLHLALASFHTGNFDDAIRYAGKVVEMRYAAADMLGLQACAHARAGRMEQARAIFEDLEDRAQRGEHVAPHTFALIHVGFGNSDLAVDWLERAFEQRTFVAGYIAVEPFWDSLRGHPRFQALVQRLHL